MKRLFCLLLLLTLGAAAGTPLLPVRLEINENFCGANDTVFLKLAILDVADETNLWSNSELAFDGEPLEAIEITLKKSMAAFLLGDGKIPNMEPLPEDLFDNATIRKLRIWFSKTESGFFQLLTPELDIVPAPYALSASALSGDAATQVFTLENSLGEHGARLSELSLSLNKVCTGEIAVPCPHAEFLNKIYVDEKGNLSYLTSSSIIDPVPPIEPPTLYAVSGTSGVGSFFGVTQSDVLKSVTLYFGERNQIAPPEAVAIYMNIPDVTFLTCASAVNTQAFPRCVYSFNYPLASADYIIGLRKTENYQTLYPYVSQTYRRGLHASSETKLMYQCIPQGVTISRTLPDYWSTYPEKIELWSQLQLAGDTAQALSGEVGWNGLSQEVKSEVLTKSGGVVTGALFVSELRLPENSNYTLFPKNYTVGWNDLDEALQTRISAAAASEPISWENLDVNLQNRILSASENNPITWSMLDNSLQQNLVTSDGGAITGALYVADLQLPPSGNWYVGSESNRCDIVLVNTNACVRAEGKLVLAAGKEIEAASFLSLGAAQSGRVDLAPGETAAVFYEDNLTEEAVISLTPRTPVLSPYWAEVDELGRGLVHLLESTNTVLSFYYTILRK